MNLNDEFRFENIEILNSMIKFIEFQFKYFSGQINYLSDTHY